MFRFKSRSRFAQLFISFLYVILIPLLILSGIYLYSESKNFENTYEDLAKDDLESASFFIENLLNGAESMALQLTFTTLVHNILYDPDKSASVYGELRDKLQYYTAANRLFHSIYIYIKANDVVVTSSEGLYPLNEFYDKDIIDKSINGNYNKKWFPARTIGSGFQRPNTNGILTFAVMLPVAGPSANGYLMVNIKQDVLFEMLKQSGNEWQSDIFILDGEGRIIANENKYNLYPKLEGAYIIDKVNGRINGSNSVKIGKNKFYAAEKKAGYHNWSYISMISASDLSVKMNSKLTIVYLIFAIVLFAGLPLSYFFSKRLLTPWKKLMDKVGNEFYTLSLPQEERDEFKIMYSALDDLLKSQRDIKAVIEENKPILQEKLITDVFMNNIYDPQYLMDKLESVGIKFEHPDFMPMVTILSGFSIDNVKYPQGALRLYIKEIIEKEFSLKCKVFGILFDEDKLAFVLNIEKQVMDDELKKDLSQHCENVKKLISRNMNILLCFSFGPLCSDLSNIRSSFIQAKKAINYKALLGEYEIIFSDEKQDELLYPAYLHRQLVIGVKTLDEFMVADAVEDLFSKYIYEKRYSNNELQHMITLLICGVINEIWQEEGDYSSLCSLDIFKQIQECSNSKMLKEFMKSFFIDIITKKNDKKEILENSHYINKVAYFIQLNFYRDITISDIAKHVWLNHFYLSRIFKQSTGKTLMEYLAQCRLKKAKELLEADNLNIQEISKAVGYKEVHTFIRAFKKSEGITPGEYRAERFNSI